MLPETSTAEAVNDSSVEFFTERGYLVVEDCLPIAVAAEISDAFSEATWDQVYFQERKDHFKHVFSTDSEYLPGADEVYLAKFSRSSGLEKGEIVNNAFQRYIKPILDGLYGEEITSSDLRCIGMFRGDYMRVHIDDYAGDVGFILYLNKRWIWDWGGLLAVARENDIEVFLPKFNRMVVVNHGRFRHPHFVTPISEYSLEARFTIVGFCR